MRSTAGIPTFSRATAPLTIGVAGVGGYAGVICEQLLTCGREHASPVKLCHVCEPEPHLHHDRVEALRSAGVTVSSNLEDLLATDVEAVWLPLPIELHRSCTERALAAGKAVMVEKPAAGCVQDVDAMIAARDAAGLPVAVGFQHIYDPQILRLKRELHDGCLGKVESASVSCCWPRDDRYYQRNAWAGHLRRNGVWVLDSPASNAMAHYINLLLFLLAPEERCSVAPVAIEAELYRANAIETYDTCSLRLHLPGGQTILVLLTHACRENIGPHMEIRGQRGVVRIPDMTHVEVAGQRRRLAFALSHMHGQMQQAFVSHVRGEADGQCAIATLEMARCHTLTVNGASEAAPVVTLGGELLRVHRSAKGGRLTCLPGIEAAFAICQERNQMLHESGLMPWSVAAGSLDLRDYTQFAGPHA